MVVPKCPALILRTKSTDLVRKIPVGRSRSASLLVRRFPTAHQSMRNVVRHENRCTRGRTDIQSGWTDVRSSSHWKRVYKQNQLIDMQYRYQFYFTYWHVKFDFDTYGNCKCNFCPIILAALHFHSRVVTY